MKVLVVLGAVLLIGASALAVVVWRRARRLRALDRHVRSETLESRSTFPTLTLSPAKHLMTLVGAESLRVSWSDFPEGVTGNLGVTEKEVVLAGSSYADIFHVPLSRVFEASLLGQFENLQSSADQTLLKLTWRRGGERVVSIFLIEGRRVAAERIRRETHLRAGLGDRPTMPVMP